MSDDWEASPSTEYTTSSPSGNNPLSPSLHLTVRFSASLPDVHLDIPSPNRTTIVALKHRIRERLLSSVKDSKDDSTTAKAARSRLRFIHAGKILPDTATVSAVLRPPPPPPVAVDVKGKGKAVDRQQQQQRVYVNCSIGDELTDEELATEAAAAAFVPAAPVGTADSSSTNVGKTSRTTGLHPSSSLAEGQPRSRTSTREARQTDRSNAPRGFDRFLSAGFTPAEVNQLRLQFTSIQASRFTPDTMPSPDTLRAMEDAWIDNNHGGVGGPGLSIEGGDDGTGDPIPIGTETDGFNGMVDTLVKGMFIGFVFPLGAIAWVLREEGMLSKRWRVSIAFGVVFGFGIGVLRALSADDP